MVLKKTRGGQETKSKNQGESKTIVDWVNGHAKLKTWRSTYHLDCPKNGGGEVWTCGDA